MEGDDFVVVNRHDVEQIDDVAAPVSPNIIDKIRSWLSPTEFESEGSEYRKHLNAHVPETGDWLFQTEQYKKWHGSGDKGTLWIKGIPGSGKSVIAANLIQTLAKNENAPVLFFFSRRILRSNSEPRYLVRDCLYQTLDHSILLQLRLKQVMEQHPEVEHIPFHELWRTLISILPTIPKVYVVFDALDELSVEQDAFLDNLLYLGQIKPLSIKLIVTSRPLPHLQKMLKGPSFVDLRLTGRLMERDIATYITYRMTCQRERNFTMEDQSAVKDALCRKCPGLFLYARLMLDELLKKSSPVHSQLKQLPGSLGDMYVDLLHEHSVRSGVSLEFQSLLLSWITHSSRALRLTELAALINSLGNRGGLNESQDAKLMVCTSCGPLLEVLQDETIQVIHHTFTEFLLDTSRSSAKRPKESVRWFPAFMSSLVHRSLTSACVDYLLSGCFESWSVKDRQATYWCHGLERQGDLMVRSHILQYASQNWLHHAAKCDAVDVELFSKFDKFLRYGGHEFESWKDFWFSKEATPDGFYPLHVAAQSGLTAYAVYLLEKGEIPDRVDSHQRTAAAYAAIHGHSEVLAALLDHNACPTTYDSMGLAPVHHAAKGNHVKVLRYLLAAGVDPMSPKAKEDPPYYQSASLNTPTLGKTPVQYACELGNTDAVVELLQYMRPQSRDAVYPHWASSKGQAKLLSLLLQYPEVAANINKKDERGNTPLYLAACIRDSATVRVLLDYGADVHARSDDVAKTSAKSVESRLRGNNRGFTPLQGWANIRGQKSCIQPQNYVDETERVAVFLMEAGCDIEARNDVGETVLFAWTNQPASGRGDPDWMGQFVSLLLKYGANPCATDQNGNNPLHKLLLWKKMGIVVRLLIKAGADINATNESDGSTPLITAAKAQHFDVSAFIDHGADPNRQDSDGNTALHHICKSWSLKRSHVQEWLAFADPKIKNKAGETCLYNLSKGNTSKARVEAIQLLIEKGVDLESRNVQGRTALLAACQNGEPHFIFGLLQYGADARARDFQNKSCLHALAKTKVSNEDGGEKDFKKTLNVIQCLIRAGANINAVDYAGNTPFHDAIESSHNWESVKVNLKSILKAGGVANRSNHRGRTALHMAAALKPEFQYYISEEHPSKLAFLLQQDLAIDLHARDHEGIMGIHLAALTSEINTWKLARAGADLQAQTLDGRTPLHFAAGAAQSNIVGLLCQLYGEKSWIMDQKDANGRTALHEAASSGNSESVYFLLQSGADPNVKDKQGLTPLHAAAEHQSGTGKLRKQRKYERTPYCEDLPHYNGRLASYLDLENGISNGQSCLTLTIGQEEEARITQDVVRLLLSAGADPAALDKFGHTAYDRAVISGCEALVDVLSSRRQEIHSNTDAASLNPLADRWYLMRTTHAQDIAQSIKIDDIKSHTLLETAIYLKNEAIVNAILQAGADPTTMSADGLTAVHTAAYWGLTSMMKIISSYVEDLNTFSPPLLHVAASRELPNIQMVDLLVKLGVNVNALYQEKTKKHEGSNNPIPSYAAIHIFAAGKKWWHTSALQSLCDAGAELELTDGNGKTALQCAISGNRSGSHGTGFWRDETLELLLTKGANVNALSPDNGSTPLLAALESKRGPKLIRKLLDRGADISLGKLPALFAAIESEDPEATAAVLEAGADFNAMYRPAYAKMYNKGPKIETPLLAAAIKNDRMVIGTNIANSRASIIALLLQYGSNPAMELKDGETTVLHEIAYFSGLLGPILEAGVDLEIKDRQGRTPLLVACSPIEISYLAIRGEYATHELIRAGANIHATDNAGSTPLHTAAASGLVQTVALLISHGASVSATNNAGLTPLYYALSNLFYHPERFQIVQILLSAGANPLVTSPNGETALHLLAPSLYSLSPADNPDAQELQYQTGDQTEYFTEFTQIYQRFVQAGCDRNARDNFGNTPLFPYVAAVKPRCEIFPYVPPACEDLKHMFEQHDVFAVNDKGDTLLHVIAGRKDDNEYNNEGEPPDGDSVTLFRELMERGLDPRKENKEELSALDVAAAYRKEGVLRLFGRED